MTLLLTAPWALSRAESSMTQQPRFVRKCGELALFENVEALDDSRRGSLPDARDKRLRNPRAFELAFVAMSQR